MNWVVHRRATPTKETPVASGPNTTKVRELTVSAQPTVSNPHVPVMLLYSERWTEVEEVVVTYQQREYRNNTFNPLIIPPSLLFLALTPIILALYYTIGHEKPYYNEEVSEYGCPDIPLVFLYGAIGYGPCGVSTGGNYRDLPVAEEIRQTDPTVELRYPLAYWSVQVKVAAQGVKWQKDTFLTVITDAEGQRRIPLDSMFKEFSDAPLEVTVILTADEAHTTVHLDSQVSEAIYTHVKK